LTAHQVGPGSNDADKTRVTGDELSLVAASTAVPRCAFLGPASLRARSTRDG